MCSVNNQYYVQSTSRGTNLGNEPNSASNESWYDVVESVWDHPRVVILDRACAAADTVDYHAANT